MGKMQWALVAAALAVLVWQMPDHQSADHEHETVDQPHDELLAAANAATDRTLPANVTSCTLAISGMT